MIVGKPKLLTPPAESLVSVEEMKQHARVDFDNEDDLIDVYIAGATNHLDGYAGVLGRCLIDQSWTMSLSDWPSCPFRLPFPDVSDLVVTYFDASGVEQSVASGEFELVESSRGAVVHFADGFSAPAVSSAHETPIILTMTAGYGDADAVPKPIKVAVMMLAAHWILYREASGGGSEIPFGVNALIAPYRTVAV